MTAADTLTVRTDRRPGAGGWPGRVTGVSGRYAARPARRAYPRIVYDVAFSVVGCLRAGTRVDVAWAVDAEGLGDVDLSGALMITPGGGRIGSLLGGALDEPLVEAARARREARLVTVGIGITEALVAGLPPGARVRCALAPAEELPEEFWAAARDRRPVALVLDLDGDRLTGGRCPAEPPDGPSRTEVRDGSLVTVLRPVPQLVLVGGGPIAAALQPAAGLLGWRVTPVTDAGAVVGVLAALSALDKVVVIGHDEELAGTALAAALSGPAGYIGLVGGRRALQRVAEWLAYRDVTDLGRVHGPAGLEIGAQSPAEVALAVLAEALAVSTGNTAAVSERPALTYG